MADELSALVERVAEIRAWHASAGSYPENVGPIGKMLFSHIEVLLSALTSTQDLLRQAERDLLKCAADCHRAKWQFQEGENDRPAVNRVNRAAFDALHNIGVVANNAAHSLSQAIAKKIGTEE